MDLLRENASWEYPILASINTKDNGGSYNHIYLPFLIEVSSGFF
ncbi:hypothetical protein [Flagellimonas algicola]|nr:hypothetical protein [Allomuricauda algicola]